MINCGRRSHPDVRRGSQCNGRDMYFSVTVNQLILAAVKFGVSENKVIWRLLNLASPCPVLY